jgi:hypothetical protein
MHNVSPLSTPFRIEKRVNSLFLSKHGFVLEKRVDPYHATKQEEKGLFAAVLLHVMGFKIPLYRTTTRLREMFGDQGHPVTYCATYITVTIVLLRRTFICCNRTLRELSSMFCI